MRPFRNIAKSSYHYARNKAAKAEKKARRQQAKYQEKGRKELESFLKANSDVLSAMASSDNSVLASRRTKTKRTIESIAEQLPKGCMRAISKPELSSIVYGTGAIGYHCDEFSFKGFSGGHFDVPTYMAQNNSSTLCSFNHGWMGAGQFSETANYAQLHLFKRSFIMMTSFPVMTMSPKFLAAVKPDMFLKVGQLPQNHQDGLSAGIADDLYLDIAKSSSEIISVTSIPGTDYDFRSGVCDIAGVIALSTRDKLRLLANKRFGIGGYTLSDESLGINSWVNPYYMPPTYTVDAAFDEHKTSPPVIKEMNTTAQEQQLIPKGHCLLGVRQAAKIAKALEEEFPRSRQNKGPQQFINSVQKNISDSELIEHVVNEHGIFREKARVQAQEVQDPLNEVFSLF